MRAFARFFLPLVAFLAVWSSVSAAPAAQRVALRQADLPAGMSFVRSMTAAYLPARLNANTVPFGLTARQLKSAGVTGLYTQAFAPSHTNDPRASYSWLYMSFSRPAGAHQIYSTWVKKFKYPFTQDKGKSTVCAEGRYQRVVSMPPPQWGLMCRNGQYVILGHFRNKAGVTTLMRDVVKHM